MTSAVEVQQAALRIALRSKEPAVELADWLIAEDDPLFLDVVALEPTKEERERFTERDLKMMEIGFTNYGRQ